MIENADEQAYPAYEADTKKRYSGADFWIKLKLSAKTAGRELVEKSLWLLCSKTPGNSDMGKNSRLQCPRLFYSTYRCDP